MQKVWSAWKRLSSAGKAAVIVAAIVIVIIAALGGSGKAKTTSATSTLPATTSPPITSAPPTTAAPLTTQPPTTTTTLPALPAESETAPPQPPLPAPAPIAGAGTCHATGVAPRVLPDTSCTPGATNPAVTQANIAQTICTSGWTDTVRPPESYTEPLKRQGLVAYGFAGPLSGFEEDHLIPLELGGNPADRRNLWSEPGASPNPKDAVENAANKAVCSGQMPLAAAQQAIATNWVALGQQLGVPA